MSFAEEFKGNFQNTDRILNTAALVGIGMLAGYFFLGNKSA